MQSPEQGEGTLKVVLYRHLRSSPRRLRPQGFECHSVDRWWNCSPTVLQTVPDATFINFLKFFFLITLGLGVQNIILYYMIKRGIQEKGIVLLGFTDVFLQAAQGLFDNPAALMQDIGGEGAGVRRARRLALHGRLVTLRSYLAHWLKI